MDLIFGGAYQGKREYAVRRFGLLPEQLFECRQDGEIRFDARCLCGLEVYTRWCVQNGTDAVEEFRKNRRKWNQSILICEDIFCGVVPLGADLRAWREMTGRLCIYLSGEASSVTRIFCGLEQRLK